tara:strand:- start:588 stop:890 length:303 start_codon:yes stop_codon:yes gene_type:complete
MILGILVNTDRHLHHVIGLVRAATQKNHEVVIFAMDTGIKLLENDAFIELSSTPGVSMSYCDYNAGQQAIRTDGLPEEIICGSQLNNSMMNHDADRVIVL